MKNEKIFSELFDLKATKVDNRRKKYGKTWSNTMRINQKFMNVCRQTKKGSLFKRDKIDII